MNTILILNAGSSSLKFKLFNYNNTQLDVLANGQFSKTNTTNPKFNLKINEQNISEEFNNKINMDEMINLLNNLLKQHLPNIKIIAIGHRVVHGGEMYIKPTLIDNSVIEGLKSIIYLTPIHLPHNIAPMEVCGKIFTNIPQVACFDTAFHSTIDNAHRTYAIPKELTENEKIKRYGFHGLSYEYLINKLAENDNTLANGKVVIAHLGAGASICALNNKQSVDTTMGLTPLEGLVMATRCGSIDPSIILYLMRKGLSYQEIENIVYFQSGLLGVSGISADFYTLSKSDELKAKEAFNLFANSVTKHVLALSSTLKGIDAIIFAGGIGENSYELRKNVLDQLNWLGFEVDIAANKQNNMIITSKNSKLQAFVIPTEEELMIAKHTINLLKI
ncbi:acetate/propionate family kinase [Rickettsiales bacterium LUAb2]